MLKKSASAAVFCPVVFLARLRANAGTWGVFKIKGTTGKLSSSFPCRKNEIPRSQVSRRRIRAGSNKNSSNRSSGRCSETLGSNLGKSRKTSEDSSWTVIDSEFLKLSERTLSEEEGERYYARGMLRLRHHRLSGIEWPK